MKTKELSFAPFVRPPAIVHCIIFICVSRDWLQTTYSNFHSRHIYAFGQISLSCALRNSALETARKGELQRPTLLKHLNGSRKLRQLRNIIRGIWRNSNTKKEKEKDIIPLLKTGTFAVTLVSFEPDLKMRIPKIRTKKCLDIFIAG